MARNGEPSDPFYVLNKAPFEWLQPDFLLRLQLQKNLFLLSRWNQKPDTFDFVAICGCGEKKLAFRRRVSTHDPLL